MARTVRSGVGVADDDSVADLASIDDEFEDLVAQASILD